MTLNSDQCTFDQAAASTMDGILDTVSANHPIVHLINLVKPLGKFILLGLPEKPPELPIFPIIMGKYIMVLFSLFS